MGNQEIKLKLINKMEDVNQWPRLNKLVEDRTQAKSTSIKENNADEEVQP